MKTRRVYKCWAIRVDNAEGALLHTNCVPLLYQDRNGALMQPHLTETDTPIQVKVTVEYQTKRRKSSRSVRP